MNELFQFIHCLIIESTNRAMKEKGKSNLFPFGHNYEGAITLFEMRMMQGKAGARGKGPSSSVYGVQWVGWM